MSKEQKPSTAATRAEIDKEVRDRWSDAKKDINALLEVENPLEALQQYIEKQDVDGVRDGSLTVRINAEFYSKLLYIMLDRGKNVKTASKGSKNTESPADMIHELVQEAYAATQNQ